MPEKKPGKKGSAVFSILRILETKAAIPLRVFYKIFAVEALIGIVAWCALADGLKDLSGTPIGADFINVYAAGVLVLQGSPGAAYDWALHHQVEQTVAGYASPYFAWHYPPMFLAVAGLVACVPYLGALALYTMAGLAGYWAIIRKMAAKTKDALWMMAVFPGVFANATNGQNGFITTALFGAGFLELEKRPLLAGAAFGLLAYKPQFFIVIPLMLAIGGYGRAFFSTIATAALSATLSWAVFGTETWRAFFESTKLTQHIVLEQGSTGWEKIQSVFSMVRIWGGGVAAAYAFQIAVMIAALACAAWIWRHKASIETRASALCAAILLTTPYLLDYDLVILAVPIALLTRQGGETGYKRFEKPLLAALWILPLVARASGSHYLPFTPPLLVALMGLCLVRTLPRKTAAVA
ncbi:MAG: glycosyltransferase family 87 protein [Bdellovibrionales bacterium]